MAAHHLLQHLLRLVYFFKFLNMRQNIRLVLCGGGTGGHIIPNIAIIQELKKLYPGISDGGEKQRNQLELLYIGERGGMEQQMVAPEGIPFKGIWCGKLRRYFSWRNFIDFLKLPIGITQAFFILKKFKPSAVFCKGGYVSFPVAVGAWLARIRVILHESDITPGMANKLCSRFANVICLAHEETKQFFEQKKPHLLKKIIVTGNPVRRSLTLARAKHGLAFANLKKNKPIILILGGSLGAEFINKLVFKNLDYLLKRYEIIHICGKGKLRSEEELQKFVNDKKNLQEGYRSYTFVGEDLKDVYAAADVVVSRAGALTLAELDFFEKPTMLIPLPGNVSRRDQIENAEVYAKHHVCRVLLQEDITDELFLKTIEELVAEPHHAQEKQKNDSLQKIIELLISNSISE